MAGDNAALSKNVKCQTLINLTDENRFQDFQHTPPATSFLNFSSTPEEI